MPVPHIEYESTLAAARAELDEIASNLAWEAGRHLTMEYAIALAHEEQQAHPATQSTPLVHLGRCGSGQTPKSFVLTARLRVGLPLERQNIKLLPALPESVGIAPQR